MNIVILQGRPTREPEIYKSENNKVYCRLRFAVEGPYRGPTVQRKTDYFDVICFDRTAQTVYNNVAKGALCTILGKLEQSEYIDKVGNKRERVKVIASKVTIHEWLRKHRPLKDLDAGFDDDDDLLVPREITNSLFKQIDIDDEDIPDDLLGRDPFKDDQI